MVRHILAIDLGTSALKVALVSTSGEVVASEQETCQVRLLPGGGAEQSPEHDWWDPIVRAAGRLAAAAAVPPSSVVAVCCTAQWSGTVPVLSDGRPVRDAIIWMDARGAAEASAVTRGPVRIQGYGIGKLTRWVRTTAGLPSRSGKDSIAHILWLKRREPSAYARTSLFLEPKDWLNLRLTGRGLATFDSIALHWVTDNRRRDRIDYDPRLLRLAGLDRGKLPDLVAATDVVGPLLAGPAAALGVPAGIPVVAGTPDVHSAAIGSGATRDFQAHLYVGTSSWLTCHVPFKKTDLLRNIASLPAAIPGRYLVADEQETAGAALTFLRDRVLFPHGTAPPDAYRQFDEMAARSPAGAGGLIFTPWLYGERTPVEDHFIRGGFHNVSLGTGRDDLVRAVFEGVALNTRWLLRAVERLAGRRLDPIRFIGGGARSAVWCRIFADVLDRTIEQVADPVNAGVRGAAMLAAVTLGDLSFEEVPDRVPVAATYRPDPAYQALYDRLFAEFTGLYKRNRRAHARLNQALPASALGPADDLVPPEGAAPREDAARNRAPSGG